MFKIGRNGKQIGWNWFLKMFFFTLLANVSFWLTPPSPLGVMLFIDSPLWLQHLFKLITCSIISKNNWMIKLDHTKCRNFFWYWSITIPNLINFSLKLLMKNLKTLDLLGNWIVWKYASSSIISDLFLNLFLLIRLFGSGTLIKNRVKHTHKYRYKL